jgi:hypothetical protein
MNAVLTESVLVDLPAMGIDWNSDGFLGFVFFLFWSFCLLHYRRLEVPIRFCKSIALFFSDFKSFSSFLPIALPLHE